MKKTIVIYNSQTGFTKRYAQWIAEELSCNCVSFKEKDSLDLGSYETIIFGSWCHAGSIVKSKWFLEKCQSAPDKNYIAFAVGASPIEAPSVAECLKRNFPEESSIKAFYLLGGLNYDKMGFFSRLMMKMLCSMLKGKPDKTPEEEEMYHTISHSCDLTDRKFIEPVIEAAKL